MTHDHGRRVYSRLINRDPAPRCLGQRLTDTDTAIAAWTVWDNREQVATFSKGIEAHKACVNTRHTSPDSNRRLSLYDPMGRIVAVYIDGREQLDELSGSAFPVAGAR